MEFVKGYPPNIDQIRATFGSVAPNVFFTYGDRIYSMLGEHQLTPALRVHERVHSDQQLAMGVEPWWERYLAEPQFRFQQELKAHEAEFTAFCAVERDKTRRAEMLGFIAKRLAGPMYGKLAPFDQCKALIKRAA